MKNYKCLAYVEQADIPDDDAFETLWSLSTMRHPEDRGFSFVVRRDHIEMWLEDVKTDVANGHIKPHGHSYIEALWRGMSLDGFDCLFVCNDDSLRVKE